MYSREKRACRILQLPVKKKEENHFCTRCGEMGHGRRYCQANYMVQILQHRIHMLHKPAGQYEKFVKDNPIVSSRRNTPVQVQGQRASVKYTENQAQRPLFPHPPVQRFNPTVLPRMATNTWDPPAKGTRFQRTFSEIRHKIKGRRY